MTDRDTFAAAALTGLLCNGDFSMECIPLHAFSMADAMLRERAKTNHDAAPAARAGTPGTGDTQEIAAYRRFVGEVMNWISEATGFLHDDVLRTDDARDLIHNACMRCWNAFDRIASPEARASGESVVPQPTPRGDSDRTDKAAPRPSEGTGDTPKPISGCVSDRSKPINGPDPDSRVWETPVHTPAPHATPGECSEQRECTEPVAWGVADGKGLLATSIHRIDAVDMQSDYAYHTEIVPLYRSPTLTDAEQEAIAWCRDNLTAMAHPASAFAYVHAAALRGLLARLA